MKRKLLCVILTLVLIFSLTFMALPMTATAENLTVTKTTFAAGFFNVIAIKDDGSVWYVSNWTGITEKINGINNAVEVAILGGELLNICFILKNDNTLWAFTLGNWDEGYSTPKKIADNIIHISAGYAIFDFIIAAIDTNNDLWIIDVPHRLEGNCDFRKIMSGVADVTGNIDFVLKLDGSVWSVGDDSKKIMDNVIQIDNDREDMLYALKNDGSMWVFGRSIFNFNEAGTLQHEYFDTLNGAYYEVYYDFKTPFCIMNNITSLSFGALGLIAKKTDNTILFWGYDSDDVVTQLDLGDNIVYISCAKGKYIAQCYMAYVKSDGSLWAVEPNGYGFNGNRSDLLWSSSSEPIKIMEDVKVPVIPDNLISNPVPETKPNNITAKPTASNVLVNGKITQFDAYNIEDNNYFKLRDLAYILNGTQKQFEVGYDNNTTAITITSKKAYTPVGGEMTGKGTGNKNAVLTSSKIYLDGKEVKFTAYIIEGNNYFKLRDIGQAIDFGVDYDEAKDTVIIDTSHGYGTNNNKISKKDNQDGTWWINEYDSNDRIIKCSLYYNDVFGNDSVIRYDEIYYYDNGNIKSCINYASNGNKLAVTFYRTNSTIEKVENYDLTGTGVLKSIDIYDNNECVIETIYY